MENANDLALLYDDSFWYVDGLNIRSRNNGKISEGEHGQLIATVRIGNTPTYAGNAARIVGCVNAHDAMLKKLKWVLHEVVPRYDIGFMDAASIESAIVATESAMRLAQKQAMR